MNQQNIEDRGQQAAAASNRCDISVLMPVYNSERYIRESIRSVLGQTHQDFELLLAYDTSTDRTRDILDSVTDPRVRIIESDRRLGLVGALNHAMSVARGRYIARFDADDFCLPTRFAKQKQFLDTHPGIALVCTEQSVLTAGQIAFSRGRASADPDVVRAMLHLGNPLGHPTMMFRAAAVQGMGEYLRESHRYAEDFDFSHRMLAQGGISVIPEYLTVYRQHDSNLSVTNRSRMIVDTARVLSRAYAQLLGDPLEEEASLVARYVMAGDRVESPEIVGRIGDLFDRLLDAFDATGRLDPQQREAVIDYTGKQWWRLVSRLLQSGQFGSAARTFDRFRWSRRTRPSLLALGRSTLSGLIPFRALRRGPPAHPANPAPLLLNGMTYEPLPEELDDPPRLYIVIDTEAEFEWERSFDSSQTSVASVKRQIILQRVFDEYGARPIYVVEHAVASQPEGFEPLREIFLRRGCAIGAHLHPWINPPIEEEPSERNSFAGNLPPDLEERKLRVLMAQIERSFGIAPLFFKAGRYGTGPNTMEILNRLGVVVDFSIMPMTDLRARGGPDFRLATSHPYRVVGTGIHSIPMTRGQFGLLAPMPPALHGLAQSNLSRTLRVPGILSHLGLANTVPLTPEGVSPAEQIQLIHRMAAQGQRTFVLHYHSSSLGKRTPYVRNQAELDGFIRNIETVCRYFFRTLGGLPGNPADLVPEHLRSRVWPSEAETPPSQT